MIFFLLRLFFGLLGIISSILFIYSIYFLINNLYFNNQNITVYLFSNHEYCDKDKIEINKNLCFNVATYYWMIVIAIITLIMSFISIFSFLSMKKKI